MFSCFSPLGLSVLRLCCGPPLAVLPRGSRECALVRCQTPYLSNNFHRPTCHAKMPGSAAGARQLCGRLCGARAPTLPPAHGSSRCATLLIVDVASGTLVVASSARAWSFSDYMHNAACRIHASSAACIVRIVHRARRALCAVCIALKGHRD